MQPRRSPARSHRRHQTPQPASLPLSVRLRATLLEGGGETQHRLHTPARSKHLKLLDNRTFPPTYKHSDYTFPHTAAALLRPQISVGPAEISVQTLPGADLTLLINWLQALLKHNISYSCSSGWMHSLKKTFRAKMNALPRLKNALLTLFPPSSSPNQNYKKKRSNAQKALRGQLTTCYLSSLWLFSLPDSGIGVFLERPVVQWDASCPWGRTAHFSVPSLPPKKAATPCHVASVGFSLFYCQVLRERNNKQELESK